MGMSEFDKAMSEASSSLFDSFGEKALYQNRVIIDAILEQGVERQSGYGESIRILYAVTVNNSQVGNLSRGETIEFSGDVYRVTDILESDHNVTIAEVSRD